MTPLCLPLVCRLMSDWRVEMVNDDMHEFFVEFPGPDDSALLPCSPSFGPSSLLLAARTGVLSVRFCCFLFCLNERAW